MTPKARVYDHCARASGFATEFFALMRILILTTRPVGGLKRMGAEAAGQALSASGLVYPAGRTPNPHPLSMAGKLALYVSACPRQPRVAGAN